MDKNSIIYEKKNQIARIILNRPDKLNTTNNPMLRSMAKALVKAEKDNSIKAVIITGNGKAFCAGGDLTFEKEKGTNLLENDKTFRLLVDIINAIINHSKPIIASVNGYALAGGFEIMLACDIIVAAENAIIGDQHINVGLVSPWGSSHITPQIIGIRKAKELLLMGVKITGAEAEKIGLINRAVPADKLEIVTTEIATQFINKSPLAFKMTKKLINNTFQMNPFSSSELGILSSLVNSSSQDCQEGLKAFLEKRTPTYKRK